MTPEHFSIAGKGVEQTPYHYRECGLDNIFLLNGFEIHEMDGEEYVSIENVDGLWKAIGLHLVLHRKLLAPAEIKFLRGQMGVTQTELGRMLRVSDQTVARWEKGKFEMPGPADVSLRMLFLSSDVAQPEGNDVLKDFISAIQNDRSVDEGEEGEVFFKVELENWRELEAA